MFFPLIYSFILFSNISYFYSYRLFIICVSFIHVYHIDFVAIKWSFKNNVYILLLLVIKKNITFYMLVW